MIKRVFQTFNKSVEIAESNVVEESIVETINMLVISVVETRKNFTTIHTYSLPQNTDTFRVCINKFIVIFIF